MDFTSLLELEEKLFGKRKKVVTSSTIKRPSEKKLRTHPTKNLPFENQQDNVLGSVVSDK